MSRYERLMVLAEQDPDNLGLLTEAAHAAFDEQRPSEAALVIERYASIASLPLSLVNVLGLCALAEGRDEDAVGVFRALHAHAPGDARLTFNLAVALDRIGDFSAVAELITPPGDSAPAATLAIRALHQLGRLDDALAFGAAWEDREGDEALWGALAAVAADAENLDLAARWAPRAAGVADGRTTLGFLAFAEDAAAAQAHFDKALSLNPHASRALLGLGAVHLSQGRAEEAARCFDQAAESFRDHTGSWIAAGWARFLMDDVAAAEARFQRAASVDPTFSEAQGGLAFTALMQGRIEDARRLSDIALRLDHASLGGVLTRSLLLEQEDKPESAERLRARALAMPLGPRGQTLAEIIAHANAGRGQTGGRRD